MLGLPAGAAINDAIIALTHNFELPRVIQVPLILFAAGFTAAVAWSLGLLLLRRYRATFYDEERYLFAFVAGAASLSSIVFGLCVARLAYPGVLLALGSVVIAYAAVRGAYRPANRLFARLPRLWKWGLAGCCAAYGVYAF